MPIVISHSNVPAALTAASQVGSFAAARQLNQEDQRWMQLQQQQQEQYSQDSYRERALQQQWDIAAQNRAADTAKITQQHQSDLDLERLRQAGRTDLQGQGFAYKSDLLDKKLSARQSEIDQKERAAFELMNGHDKNVADRQNEERQAAQEFKAAEAEKNRAHQDAMQQKRADDAAAAAKLKWEQKQQASTVAKQQAEQTRAGYLSLARDRMDFQKQQASSKPLRDALRHWERRRDALLKPGTRADANEWSQVTSQIDRLARQLGYTEDSPSPVQVTPSPTPQPAALSPSATYRMPDGSIVRWNGSAYEVVR